MDRGAWFDRHVNLLRVISLVIILAVVAISSSRMIRRHYSHGDFGVYVHAARLMVAGRNIYTTPTRPVAEGGLFYIYPPLLAFLLVPLTWIPADVSIVLWTVLSVALVGWVVKAFYELVANARFSTLTTRNRWVIVFFPVLLTSRFILQHLDRGQANILELAILVAGFRLADRGRPWLGGGAIGLSVAIKLIGLPVLIWYCMQRSGRVLLGAAVGLAAGLLAPALLIGLRANAFLLRFWLSTCVIGGMRNGSIMPGLAYNYSPLAQLYRFFSPAVAFRRHGHPYSLMIFQLPMPWIHVVDWAVRLALAAAIAAYWLRFRNCSKDAFNGGYAIICVLLPLLFPTAQKNYFVFLLPGYIYAVYVWHFLGLQDRWFRGFSTASFMLASMTTPGLWGKFLGDVFDASGCILFGAILLAAAVFRGADCLCKEAPSTSRNHAAALPGS